MENKNEEKKTIVLKGVIGAPGIAIGKSYLVAEQDFSVIPRKILKHMIKSEVERFKDAVGQVREELMVTRDKVIKNLGKEHVSLADAYLMMLDDPLLNRDVQKRISEEGINAEFALWSALERVITSFDRIDDDYFRERKNDIQDIGRRIIRHLTGEHKKIVADAPPESILIAHNIGPADTMGLKEHRVKGFATDVGGRTSHIAILAQGLEVPAVVGMKNVTTQVADGDMVVIDGNQGIVIINPDELTLENYRREFDIQLSDRQELEKLRDLPAQTIDGHRIVLAANIDSLDDVAGVLHSGAEGIGLLRTEFLYLRKGKIPTEDEHFEFYKTIATRMLPYSVIIRTLDVGGDKLAQMGFEGFSMENNPFLGLRAIRLCLKYPDMFRAQLRGILRASKFGKVKIMFPMIAGVEEVKQAKVIVEEAKKELKGRGEQFDEDIEVGVMIEIPSAAMTADIIAQEVDFLSIGTNDLIQYTLAVDRTNENVAYMYEPLHLSILRLLKRIIDAGHNAGKWVGMCGDMAAETTFTLALIGMGLNELSVTSAAVPKIKQIIRSSSFTQSKDLAREVLSSSDRDIVVKTLRKTSIA
jgi:phosphotransferase system enzyme I (PtsI)